MKIPTMRRIDLLIGVPLSWLANGVYVVARAVGVGRHQRAAAVRRAPRRLLAMKFLGLGSLILAGPLLRALRERHPACRIELATFDENRDAAAFLPMVDEVHVVRRTSLTAFIADTARLLVRCWTRRYDVLLDLEVYSKYTTLLAAFSGAPVRAGFFEVTTRFRRGIYSELAYFNRLRHVVRVYATLGRPFGIEAIREEPVRPVLGVEPEAEVDAFLDGEGVGGRDLLLVNPNASDLCLERRWPPERFATVVGTLLGRRPELVAVYVGGPEERGFSASARDLVSSDFRGRVLLAAGRLSLRAFGVLLSRARLLLSNDSGPVHLAWALSTPTVSLWGPGTPAFYGPLGTRHEVLYAGVPCSPCLYFTDTPPCGGDNVCMKVLGESEVVAACERLLASGSAGSRGT